MDKNSKIFVAGHRGMVGSAILKKLEETGHKNIITRTHQALDLTRQKETEGFFEQERPDFVFLAAARVGGILANRTYTADFIYQNIMISANIINAGHKFHVKKLLNLGSTCIYPKLAPQPMKEEDLLSGYLEPTNEPYAVAKIAAIKLCRYYNHQYKTNFMSVMPTNLYGVNDNYNLETSHLLPAFIRKFHLAKLLRAGDFQAIKKDFGKYGFPFIEFSLSNSKALAGRVDAGESFRVLLTRRKLNKKFSGSLTSEAIVQTLGNIGITTEGVTLWGSGVPSRELLHADDLAEACVFLMQKYDAPQIGEFVNIGVGKGYEIKEIAGMVKDIVGFEGKIFWDTSKPDGTPKKIADVSRINTLGWKAKTELPEGIGLVYVLYKSSVRLNRNC